MAQSPMVTIAPPSGCPAMIRPARWQQRNVPSVLISNCRRTSAAVTSSSGFGSHTAAAVTNTSSRPKVFSTSSNSRATSFSLARSA